MRTLCVVVICTGLHVALSVRMHAQPLEERLRNFEDEFAKGFTTPFIDAFGASMNSGWYHSANVDDGLDVFIGGRVILMPISDDAKTFRIASLYDQTTQEIPTVFGDDTETPISGAPQNFTPDRYPGGFDVSFAPMVVPHFSVGNIFGTRVMIRFLPGVELGEFGEFSFVGFGVQHSLSRYLEMFPLDISAMVAYQNLDLGNLISSDAFTFGIQGSKTISALTVYGGLAYETSKMSFGYTATFTDPQNPGTQMTRRIEYEANGKNDVRATIGFALSLAIIKINADYSVASQPVATVGIGVGL